MADFTIDDLKRALVEVREICKKGKCVTCPFRKVEEETGIPRCPLYEDEYGMAVQFPICWDIEDWKEDSHE